MKTLQNSRLAFGLIVTLFAATQTPAALAEVRWGNNVLRQDSDWYASAEARSAADTLLLYQSSLGAWPKNTDLFKSVPPDELARIHAGSEANTIDNGATTTPMRFLARVIKATDETKYEESFARGLNYLFDAQYPNGGWPQFYPLRKGYYSHITFNDDAMMNVMNLLRDVADGKAPYEFVDRDLRAKAAAAVAKGIDCILRTQIREDGQLTVWCAQYDEVTLAPAKARAYELPSLSGGESAGILEFLMSLEKPAPEVVRAVNGGVAWFASAKISGYRYEKRQLIADASAPPIWARFYEIETNRLFFSDRDGVPKYDLSEIGTERRNGYAWYNTAGDGVAKAYAKWPYR